MFTQEAKFHLAIPSHDIQASMAFYAKLGCKLGRFSDKFCIIDFFGAQVVCHLSDKIDKDVEMYPRHYGWILNWQDWNLMHQLAIDSDIEFFQDKTVRYEGKAEEHRTFFIKDPSNNLIEFKYYLNRIMI